MHDYLRTEIVAPMTTGNRPAPFRIEVSFKGKTGLILLDQIRTLEKVRLIKKADSISEAKRDLVLKTLAEVFSL